MNIHIDDGLITVTFPITEIVVFTFIAYLIIFFGVLTAVIVSRGII